MDIDNKKLFFRFLKEKGVYAAYRRNFGLKYLKTWHNDLYRKIGVDGKTFFDVVHWTLYINHAFHWASTKEGHEFWKEISREWSKK
jgi:hypothetical protein